jgi:L-Lysine epsilon oxidase N-terminal
VKKLEGYFLTKTVLLGSISIEQNTGCLIFRGGEGYAECVDDAGTTTHPDILAEFDNLNWYDDVCDGWVDVKVERDGW